MAMSYTDFLLRPSRTSGAGRSAGMSGNMAAPNSQAVTQAVPNPTPQVSGGVPPELMALMGGAGAAPPSPSPAPSQGIDMQAEAEAAAIREMMGIAPQMLPEDLLGMMGPEVIPPDPMAAAEVGVQPQPMVSVDPQKLTWGFDPQFRAKFFEKNHRFPSTLDYKADSLARDILSRTGRPASKEELMAELTRPRPAPGISEFGGPVM